LNIPVVKKNVDICLFASDKNQYDKNKLASDISSAVMFGELKGGIDPAGADEHWKTANTALDRIRKAYESNGITILTSFLSAAIEANMADEIFEQYKSGIITKVANLTKADQLISYCNWVLEL
jgi:type II restriction enzyme